MASLHVLLQDPSILGDSIDILISRKKIDLREIDNDLVADRGWSYQRVCEVRGKYIRFTILSEITDEKLTPSDDVSEYGECHRRNKVSFSEFNRVVFPVRREKSPAVRVVSGEETRKYYFAVFRGHLDTPEVVRARICKRQALKETFAN